jgi:purine-binding chemotaxis protein CheW
MPNSQKFLDDFLYCSDEEAENTFQLGLGPESPSTLVRQGKPDEYLAFVLDGEQYALPIDEVREIVKVPVLTEVPGGKQSLLGILNLRGEILAIYNVKPRLGLSEASPSIAGPDARLDQLSKSARILIVHGQNVDCGILVDRVVRVIRQLAAAIEPRPPHFHNERASVLGLSDADSRPLTLLNLRTVLE